MSARHRLARAFAFGATFLMLFMAADSTVVKIALAEPIVSPAAGANNNTTPPPPPPPPVPPPDEPQRPVEPGTVTQGWDNSSFTPAPITELRDVAIHEIGNETSYDTAYGNFVLNKSSPYFVTFVSPGPDSQEIAESAFLVLYQGLTLLSPTNGIVDNATSDELSFHYGLYLSAVLLGTMNVDYVFHRDANKIAISFSPSVGLPNQYQIVWLTFTTFDAIDTAYPSDVEQRFEDLTGLYGSLFLGADVGTLYGTGTTQVPGAIIRPQKIAGSPGGPALRMDASDASSDFNGTFAGELTFDGRSGNAALSTFVAGKFTIDPQLIFNGVDQDATAYSGIQRKTFFDGDRYWLFYKYTGDGISEVLYRSSPDEKSWSPLSYAIQLGGTGTFSYGFTVASYGKTVAVLWVDSNSANSIWIRTGLISADAILWDDSGHKLYTDTYPHNMGAPVTATFTGQGTQLGISWIIVGNAVGFARYQCSQGTGFSSCAIQTITAQLDSIQFNQAVYSLVTAFNDVSGGIVNFMVSTATGSTHIDATIYHGDGTNCPSSTTIGITAGNGVDWINKGLFTAASSGNLASVFFLDTSTGQIHDYDITDAYGGCSLVADSAVPDMSMTPGSGTQFLTAGTEQDGQALYLFYSGLVGSYHEIYYARVVPNQVLTGPKTVATLTAYTEPSYVTSAQVSSDFIPVMFTRAYSPPGLSDGCTTSWSGWCLYYVGYPLPLNGEASINNPWSNKLGAPLTNDGGGAVSPTTGLLASGQTLIGGTPALPIIYREPGLYYWDGAKDVIYSSTAGYPIVMSGSVTMPGMYYDLPWIDGMVHLQGGQQFPLYQTGKSGSYTWYNNTKGIRYTLVSNGVSAALTFPSGAYIGFIPNFSTNSWTVGTAYPDTTGQNYVTYGYTNGALGGTLNSVTSSGRTITISTGQVAYGSGQVIKLNDLGGPTSWGISNSCSDTSSQSRGLQVVDAIGRSTNYYVCGYKLIRLDSPNGGRVDHAYATSSNPDNRVWQGTDVYSLPLLKMDIYNESGANVKARSLAFNWNFQNGEVVRALVNTTDKSAVVKGSNEYIFNSAAGTASVRVYDSAGQVLYYDMETLNGANLKDLSGNAHDGTLTGTASVYGQYGRARSFNGVSEKVDTGYDLPSQPMTLTAWVYATSLSSVDDVKGIMDKRSVINEWRLDVKPSTGKLEFLGWDSLNAVSIQVYSIGTLSTGQWYHVVLTWDGTTSAFYINGAASGGGTRIGNPITDTASLVHIGVDGNGGTGGSRFWNGNIDEVRLFGRVLSSEDIGILYSKNALKKGEQQNWYSINDQPHLVEGFVGDQTAASVVTSEAIDDWGNQIYHRDALGNETFASYANTNHQNHFYAPGRLTKTGTSNTDFIDFGDGQFPTGQGTWTVTSTDTTPAHLDYGTFDKTAPALNITPPSLSGTTKIEHPISSGPRFIEFHARVSAASGTRQFEILFGTASTSYLGIEFSYDVDPNSGLGLIKAFDDSPSPGYVSCTYPNNSPTTYALNVWYRFTFEIDGDSSGRPWKAYMNGMDLSCGALTSDSPPSQLTVISTHAAAGPWWGLLDDIKVYSAQTGYNALNIGFAGLQYHQSIRLLGEDGSVVDQGMQTQFDGTTLWLSFNSPLTGAYKYYENGDNARTAVQIYAEDGTLEYQSPLTRFFVGETYTYARPRTFADELVKTRSGAFYWPNTIYADESCPGSPSECSSWVWKNVDLQGAEVPSAVSGLKVHFTSFDYGSRTHSFSMTPASLPTYFVTYILIPDDKSPDGLALSVWDTATFSPACSPLPCWHEAYWGAAPGVFVPSGQVISWLNMGPIPTARNQWIQLVVKASDLGFVGSSWQGFAYTLAGGEAAWDVTTTQTAASWTDAYLKVSGLPSGVTVGVFYANNGTQIGTGLESGGTANVLLYQKSKGITTFPVMVNMKIYNASNEYYFGPARDIWPGDSFRYVGASSFFDSKFGGTSYWPSSSIHTALLGSKKFSGDCLDAALCYDMETLSEAVTATGNTGIVTDQLFDLSQHSRSGKLVNAPILGDVTKSSGGLGLKLDGTSAYVDTGYDLPTGSMTLSAWIYADSLSSTDDVKGIMDKRSVTNEWRFDVKPSTGKLEFVGWDSLNAVTIQVYSNVTVGAGILYHVALTWDGVTATFYINGVARGGGPKTGSSIANTASVVRIGVDGNAAQRYWNGVIDQVSIYNSVLSSTRILALYYSRLPGAPQVYVRPLSNGLANATRTPYEGTYLYATAQYDNKGNILSVTDVGRSINGGKNVTRYAYSTLDGRDYRTQVNRSDTKQIYTAYDFQRGVKYGTLDIDCRRSRTSYDVMGRPTQTSMYDTDANEVLHLDMETATYNSLKDVSCAGTQNSASGQNVTSVGGTTEASSPDGMSRNFTSGGSIIVADASTLAFGTGSFTISFWAYLAALPTSGQGRLIIKTNYPTTWWTIDFNQDRTIEFESNIGTTTSTGAGLTVGQWRHIAVVVDRSAGKVLFYFDGVLDSQPTVSFSGSPDNTQPLKAPEAGGSGTLQFNGKLDEVRIFKTALGASSIGDLRNFKYKLLTSSSVAYDDMTANPAWAGYQFTSVTSYDGVSIPRKLFLDMETKKLTIGSTTYLEDLSGNGNHPTLFGTTSVTGRIGQGRQFNGVADYAEVQQSSSVSLSNPLTVSFSAKWLSFPTGDGTCGAGASSAIPIGKATSSSSYLGSWWFELRNTGQLDFYLTFPGPVYVPFSNLGIQSLNQMYHYAATYDGQNVRLYRDGTLISTTADTRIVQTTTGSLFIGKGFGTGCGSKYTNAVIDEVHLISRALSGTEISDLFNGTEKSHMSKTYQDGLGRTTRGVVMDMFGTKITTVATMGWNDKPVYSYLPSGQYFTYTYDFLGRTLSVQTPGDSTISGISRTIVSEKARMVESIDAVGRKVYQKTDLLGRTVETAVWNVSSVAYGNKTAVAYNALSEVTTSQDAKFQTTTTYYNSLGRPRMTVFPDGTNSAIYYDDNLRAFETADVMGRVSISAYDRIGRATSITLKPSLSSGTTYAMTYTYDPVHDDLTKIDNGTAKITRGYDSLHRMVAEEVEVPAGTVIGTIGYGYDNASKVLNITYPVGTAPFPQAIYTYDSLGRPVEVDYGVSPATKYAVLTYDSFGRMANSHYWKGTTDTFIQENYSYDARDRTTQVKVYKYGTSTVYMQLDYTYNKASEIIGSTDNMLGTGKSVIYAYDGNGRLAYASGPWGTSETAESHTYTYDQVGNLLTWKAGATTYTYHPTGWNELASITNLVTSFSYNLAGSMLTKVEGGTTTYTQDFLQQLVKVVSGANTYTYSYDGFGRRVKTVDPSATSYFMYIGSQMLYSKVGTTPTESAYVYVGSRLLLKKDGTGSTPEARYYHYDISGNVRLITFYKDSNPSKGINVDAKYRYRPFGDKIVLSGSLQRFQFASQDYADTIRLYHMGARYYDPIVGRFIQRDPIGPGYHYALNNPLSFIDPTGMTVFVVGPPSRTEQTTADLLFVMALAIALAPESGGLSLILLAGVVTGAIFVAYTAVASGGRATFDDYYAAFALGFVVGTTIASVYQGFQLAGEAALARAGPAARAGAEARAFSAVGTDLNRGVAAEERIALEAPDVVSRETPLVQGTFHGVDTEGYVIEGRFVPQIEGGSGDVQGLRAKIGVDDVFENPNVLRDMPGRLKTPNEVSDLIADAQSRGLRSTRLSWGSQEGSGLKLLDTDDGRMIMYHPGGGHHGEYWKVSSGITRTTRVFPDFTEYPNGWVEVWR